MKKGMRLLITIVFVLVIISVGTYAWLNYQSVRTVMELTVGETGKISITLSPYKFNSSIAPTVTYEENDYVQVTATNDADTEWYNMKLYYKINDIPDELINQDFKYTVLRSSDGVEYEEYQTGDFSNASNGSEYVIYEEDKIDSNSKYYYRVYLWIEGSVNDNTDMQGKVFNAELRADYDKINPNLKYDVINNDLSNGFYRLSNYSCQNGTILSYDMYNKTITADGIDKCNLEFTLVDNPLLYDVVEIGDYIAYTGNNGCSGDHCSGWNANQTAVDIYDNFGHCYLEEGYNRFFLSYGWRVLYKLDGFVYIVSAGSPECVMQEEENITTINNLNNVSLKYCNSLYLAGGVCSGDTAHAFNGNDFYLFTGQYYGSEEARYLYNYNDGGTYGNPYCYQKYGYKSCGYGNDIMDNGGYYWFASQISDVKKLIWSSEHRRVGSDTYFEVGSELGVRPVLKLDSSIKLISGKGTIDEPYIISTRS